MKETIVIVNFNRLYTGLSSVSYFRVIYPVSMTLSVLAIA